MGSQKEAVSFPGIIRGGGHEANCTVLATKVGLPGIASTYCDYSVENVSKPLPEGRYQLFVNGETYALRYENGFWLAG
jgi:hypothetical protein